MAQLTTEQNLEETQRFYEHQSDHTRHAIDHYLVAQFNAVIEKVAVERQKQ